MTGTAVRRLLAAALTTGLLAGLPVVVAGPAAALSCVGPPAVLRGAEQVFTARIVEVDLDAGEVMVEVEDVWWGGPVAERLTLGLDLPGWWDGGVASGDPDPERLWVMAPVMERGRSSVNPCTAWSPGTPGVARFEPEDAGPPMSPGSGTGRAGWWSALVAGLCASLRV